MMTVDERLPGGSQLPSKLQVKGRKLVKEIKAVMQLEGFKFQLPSEGSPF